MNKKTKYKVGDRVKYVVKNPHHNVHICEQIFYAEVYQIVWRGNGTYYYRIMGWMKYPNGSSDIEILDVAEEELT